MTTGGIIMTRTDRTILVCGGVAGALGVGVSAVAAHRGGTNLGTAASFLATHAPALIAISFLTQPLAKIGGFILIAGLLLFCGDLGSRDLLGGGLFPYCAPTGGLLMIGGWLVVAASAFARPR